ncbi:MAG: xylulokinase [Clostridiaceae bacterium]
MAYLIGVDIGTSGTKTVLFDEMGKTIKSATYEYPMYQPKQGWAEQNPKHWLDAVNSGIKEVISKSNVSKEDIKGLGLSGQMHGLVILDKEDNILRDSIIWCDQRTTKECDEITNRVGKERLIELTANPALTGFTASKILWVRNNEKAIYEKIAKIMLPKDYIRYMLTGEFATEVSDASGMQLLDIKQRNWSDEVLEKLDIDKALLGKVYESCEVTGKITKAAAEITGLKEGTIVVGGAGDQAAGAIGNGIVKKGLVSSTIGTSGVVFAYTDKLTIDKLGRVHTFCHAVPNAWHVMGVTQGAGLSLKWFRDNFCNEEKQVSSLLEKDVYDIMGQEATNINPGSDGLMYLPYLMGERTPHLDPFAKGVFFGLTPSHTKSHFVRAIMEGVSYSLRDCMEIIQGMEIDVDEIRASGGGGRSPLWRQMQADNFNKDVVTINSKEGGALGVAILAGVGANIYKSVEEGCETAISVVSSTKPEEFASQTYSKDYEKYKSLYLALKDEFRK